MPNPVRGCLQATGIGRYFDVRSIDRLQAASYFYNRVLMPYFCALYLTGKDWLSFTSSITI